MTQMDTARERYVTDFARFEQRSAVTLPTWVRQLRTTAIARFAALGFPTTRQEEWKYTNVTPIAALPFSLPTLERNGEIASGLEPIKLWQVACAQLVFVNGRYAPELSVIRSLPRGVQVSDLATLLRTDPKSVESHLARYADYQNQAFVALNTAFLEDGAFVFIPQGVHLEAPVYLLFMTTALGEPLVSYPRNLIVASPGSSATIVESYVGVENEVYFTNAVTELVTGEEAMIDHARVQLESSQAFHIGALQIHQETGSVVVSHAVGLGGALARSEAHVVLDGEGSECTLNGLYMGNGRQHLDNQTRIEHGKPHCTSRELYKGVLDGQSRGVFSGKIVVTAGACKTDAAQTNKNLLLSHEAVIDSKPQLEILNNDVQCSHGSTIGELDEEALFYLRTRGVDADTARGLLTYAFVSEVLNRLKPEPLRDQLEERLFGRLYSPTQSRGASS